jgi:hypothetical protein
MIDFETFGNGENKCICQVGAVFFDNVTGELGAEFKATIDAGSHTRRGGVIDAGTVYWWLNQSEDARKSILEEPRQDVVEAMIALNDFLAPASRIWSHATFDFVTLVETLKKLNIRSSFPYKAGMDLRTLIYLSGISTSQFPREGVHHDGLADAKHQVKYTVAALNTIKTNRQAINMLKKLTD